MYPTWAIRKGTTTCAFLILRRLRQSPATAAELAELGYRPNTIQNSLIGMQRLRIIERYGKRYRVKQ
jgi:DNA-binding IclR family transcriptional regulator